MRVGRWRRVVSFLGGPRQGFTSNGQLPKRRLLLAMIAGGACLFYGLFVIQAVMAFWTIETLEIMNTVTYGGTQTAQYPLTIYHPWLRRFFTFVVPLVCMNYIPRASSSIGRNSSDCHPFGSGCRRE